MPLKNYYELLEIAPTASADEVKRSFRQQIARYHPDKVQHLGKEFQAMAADRAAELTEAYHVLSDAGRRSEYDRAFAASGGQAATAPPASGSADAAQKPAAGAAPAPPPPPPQTAPEVEAPKGAQFTRERATRDEYLRKATIGRFRQALAAVGGDYDRADVRGFDVACNPKSKLFARNKGPRLLGRFVTRVDAEAVADTWTRASKAATANDDVCVFLIGSSLASVGELGKAIAEQRKKAARGAKVTIIPVDARDWEAHLPTDAPAIAKTLLARLRSGA